MLIAITHETLFAYSEEIAESVMEVRVTPASNAHQTTRDHKLVVTPRSKLFPFRDYFGNTAHFFTVPVQHQRLAVVSTATVETNDENPFAMPMPLSIEEPARGALADYLQFGGPVGRHPELAVIAGDFSDDRNLFSRLQALNSFIFQRLEYKPLVTRVDSTLDEVLAIGKGVCQDFAHLMIGVCREMGVPARYVSGYLYSQASEARRGGGATHAWCECYLPGVGWKGFDPTNNVLVDSHHVQIATGRDYRDVPPTKGIYRGSAVETISVTVHTERRDVP
jgi:transglutaminase-like putative cysteine protease